MATDEIVARKHWIAYVGILLGYGIWFLILLGALLLIGTYQRDQPILAYVGLFVLVVLAASIFFFVWSWLDTKHFTWTAEEEKLVLRSGTMPWQKSEFGISYDTIFESYIQFGLVSKIFGYCECVIRRTEGVTTQTTASHMTNGEEVSRKINRKIKEVKALRYAGPQMISEAPRVESAKSQAEQLRELATLKADGTITAEEFDLMKRKIIQT